LAIGEVLGWAAPLPHEPARRPPHACVRLLVHSCSNSRLSPPRSGNTNFVGPGDVTGVCRSYFVKETPAATSEHFYTSGVSTLSDFACWFGGGSSNMFRTIQFYSLYARDEWNVTLGTYAPNGTKPATAYGIVSSASVWTADIGDNVAVPSADGNIYNIWWISCINLEKDYAAAVGGSAPSALGGFTYAMHPFAAEAASLEEVHSTPPAGNSFTPSKAARTFRVNKAKAAALMGRSDVDAPFPNCLQFVTHLTGPSLSPTRYVGPSQAPMSMDTLLIVSESNPSLSGGGILRALYTMNGTEAWNFPAVDAKGASQPLVGVVPALDLDWGITYIAFGTRTVALQTATGKLLASFDDGTGDPFVSSPTLSNDLDSLFMHSSSGTLWKMDLNYDGTTLTMTKAWACDYYIGQAPTCASFIPPADLKAVNAAFYASPVAMPVYTKSPAGGPPVITGSYIVPRSELVHGGFNQPTTRAERAELWEALRAAHEAKVGAPYKPLNGVDLAFEDAAIFAESIGPMALHALVTPSGYTALGPNGAPLSIYNAARGIADTLPGVYPYATPAVSDDSMSGPTVIVPQYTPTVTNDEGVFAVDESDGSLFWQFGSFNISRGRVIRFGRSRSSPTIDGDWYVYQGADIDDPKIILPPTSVPCLFVLDFFSGELVWGSTLGFEDGVIMGQASAMIMDGYDGSNVAVMVAQDGVVMLGQGVECDTDDPVLECSGHGTCDCTSGNCLCLDPCFKGPGCSATCGQNSQCQAIGLGHVCLCNPCYRGATCETQLACGAHASCSLLQDSCVCEACWNKPVLRDGNCTQAETCNGHGKCNPFGPDNATGVCACTGGWTGTKCYSGPTPSSAPYAPNAADTPAAIAAEAVGGLVFVGMLGVTGAALVFWKARNPLKQWKDVLPHGVQKQMGFSAYTTSFAAPAGSTATVKEVV
jgi:outer membrane protein assembly factor BamB